MIAREPGSLSSEAGPAEREPRSRVVVFRLSEDEYTLLKRASQRARRTLSNFTRSTVIAAFHAHPAEAEAGNAALAEVREQLSNLLTVIESVKELVQCMVSEKQSAAKQNEPRPRRGRSAAGPA